jgi:serine kinase of HPr protein (carbohydrate metabolism regulator)
MGVDMTMLSSEMLHASTVAIDGQAILITGVSGSGKSDLALRLIDRGARLVSDDYTLVTRVGRTLQASAPTNIKGKMEVRGIGIVGFDPVEMAVAALIIRLDATPERLPDFEAAQTIVGITIPALALAPFEASAPIKVELALRRLSAS